MTKIILEFKLINDLLNASLCCFSCLSTSPFQLSLSILILSLCSLLIDIESKKGSLLYSFSKFSLDYEDSSMESLSLYAHVVLETCELHKIKKYLISFRINDTFLLCCIEYFLLIVHKSFSESVAWTLIRSSSWGCTFLNFFLNIKNIFAALINFASWESLSNLNLMKRKWTFLITLRRLLTFQRCFAALLFLFSLFLKINNFSPFFFD